MVCWITDHKALPRKDDYDGDCTYVGIVIVIVIVIMIVIGIVIVTMIVCL